MSKLGVMGRVAGWSCVAIGAVQLVAGTRAEPGMNTDATVDSHVRFMGSAFVAYGLGWVEAAASPTPNLPRMRVLSGLMALGGASRLVTRATVGRPHRFHDLLLGVELAAPVVVEVLGRLDRPAR
ncbi:DUF4345 domain-containing protein [Nocardia flavorosea]|uniref:DUF4345 domain-containing protein n=1 Tax=Nocardia flavorosea TaxID=53429 RepID=A0A846YF16_9NOCA|nr:DUF4345 domain-containing protein [Nocardia flavorosea]NKY58206.1 DUF4345 domain-containing protein [Nocardia flavorosea]